MELAPQSPFLVLAVQWRLVNLEMQGSRVYGACYEAEAGMKRIAGVCGLLAVLAAGACAQVPLGTVGSTTGQGTLAPLRVDPAVKAALAGISAEQVRPILRSS